MSPTFRHLTDPVIDPPLESAQGVVGVGVRVICRQVCVLLCGVEGLQPPDLGLGQEEDVALAQAPPVGLPVDVVLDKVLSVKEALHQFDICYGVM